MQAVAVAESVGYPAHEQFRCGVAPFHRTHDAAS